MVPFLDFKPDSGKVFNRDNFAFIAKPIPCPGDWGLCSFEDLPVYVVPRIPLIANGDGVLSSWFNGKWAFDCCEFGGEGEVCVESI